MTVTAVASVTVAAVPDEGARRRAGADRQNRAAVKAGRGQVPVIKLVFPGLRLAATLPEVVVVVVVVVVVTTVSARAENAASTPQNKNAAKFFMTVPERLNMQLL